MRTCRNIEGRGHEAEEEDDKRQERGPSAIRIKRGRIVDGSDTKKAHAQKQCTPHIPAIPKFEVAKSDEKQRKDERRGAVQVRIQRTQDVAAVELRDGQEIQRSGEQPDPSGAADGVKQERGWGDAWVKPGGETTKQQRNAENKIDFGAGDVGKAGYDFGMENAVGEGGNGKHETGERAGSADVKEGAGGSNRRANQNERTKGANEGGEGNEKRVGGANVMMAAGEKVSQFMGEKNGEQSEGKGDAGGECGRAFVEKREGMDKFIIGSRLIIRVGDGELCAGDQASAKSKQE